MPDKTKNNVTGSVTTSEGQRIPLTHEEANTLWETAEKEQRAVDMPNTSRALAQINRVKDRLRDLGWQGGVYCPKDKTEFACVQFGSESEYYLQEKPYPPKDGQRADCGDISAGKKAIHHARTKYFNKTQQPPHNLISRDIDHDQIVTN